MGFIISTATIIAFSVAAVVSIILGVIGIALYVWRGRSNQQTRRVFWSVLIAITLLGIIVINVMPFPQAPAGSNYSELLNEWTIKAVVYALIPGVACLLGGISSKVARMREIKY